jgi:capsular exopolysaccharide synthesis family protein
VDVAGFFRAIRKSWWIVITTTLLGLGMFAFLVIRTPPTYASNLTFFVNTAATAGTNPLQSDQYAQQRVNSYVVLVSSERLVRMVLQDTQLTMSVQKVRGEISASSPLNTVVLDVTVTDTSGPRSLRLATSISTQFVKLIHDTDPSVNLELFSGPTLNPTPVAPKTKLDLILGGLVGIAVGIALAVIRQLADTSIRTSSALRDVANSPVLGVIPVDAAAKKAPLIVQSHAHSRRAEAFRQLRTNLQFVDADRPARVMVVTSSVGSEGKSTTAANLALSFAETEKSVLLIEGDLRRPRVSDYLGIERSVGLTNVLAGQAKIDEVLQPWGRGNLTVLPSGTVPPNPSELLGSEGMQELLAQFRTRYDLVIIDAPPLLPVTDAAVVSVIADGAVVIVRAGKTKRQQLASAMASLRSVDARILGCVLNMAPAKGKDSELAYDGYGYYELPDQAEVKPAAPKPASKRPSPPQEKADDGQEDAEQDLEDNSRWRRAREKVDTAERDADDDVVDSSDGDLDEAQDESTDSPVKS